ncbi:protein kinase [Streptomyces sp. NPDC012510]|uniref:serine/threonine-protein kinase n=1 Tax=Streptomyces sp. NPDC012510 TaxID=3364838 RepID=UPI0036E34EA5
MSGGPTRIGDYTVARRLGSGGMGEVYLAYSPVGSPVAVKVIRSDRLDPVTRQRFEKEALIARTVVGTNRVARFLDADPYADQPWLAMEYVPGRTLLEYMSEHGALSAPLVASLGALLAEGLRAVHAVRLLHRDLKPQNIILSDDGPMIIDFGLGAFMDSAHESLSHSGMIIGTVRCMPPEQARGKPHVTPAADVYALGTVLLYAATSHYPYDGAMWEAIAAQVANPAQGPDLSGVPEELMGLVSSMLAHEPEVRPSLDEVAQACTDILAAAGVSPADARWALVKRTAENPRGPVREEVPEAVLRLLEERPDDGSEESALSPLDTPHRDTSAEEPAAASESTLPPEPSSPLRASKAEGDDESASASSRPRRERAQQKVADDLRARYAMRASL